MPAKGNSIMTSAVGKYGPVRQVFYQPPKQLAASEAAAAADEEKRAAAMPAVGPLPGALRLDPAIAPKVPAGAPRPFAPGEMVENADGGWSSEISVTAQKPDGKWTVVPSLWLVDGKPVRVSEDQAIDYAEQSKLPFQTFASEAEAEKFSQAREDAWQQVGRDGARSVPPLWGAK